MKKSLRKAFKILLLVVALLCLVGCGETNVAPSEVSASAEQQPAKANFKLEDFDWNIDYSVVDGSRKVVLNYTNNSPYSILEIDFDFKEKEGITAEDRASFKKEAASAFSATEEELANEYGDEVSMSCCDTFLVSPGESRIEECCYYQSLYYIKNYDACELMEPDMLSIMYTDGDKLYVLYHDYVSGKDSTDSRVEDAYQWTKSELGDKLPRPETLVAIKGWDDEDDFSVTAYGIDKEAYERYVIQCNEDGYTLDEESLFNDAWYEASNEEGYRVKVVYSEETHSIDAHVEAPSA